MKIPPAHINLVSLLTAHFHTLTGSFAHVPCGRSSKLSLLHESNHKIQLLSFGTSKERKKVVYNSIKIKTNNTFCLVYLKYRKVKQKD